MARWTTCGAPSGGGFGNFVWNRELSQERLAERAGPHRTYVGGIERGEQNPALDNLNRLARALGVPLSELLSPFRTGLTTRHTRAARRDRS